MTTQEIRNDFLQGIVFEAIEGHQGNGRLALHGAQEAAEPMGLAAGREGEEPGQLGAEGQGGQKALKSFVCVVHIADEAHPPMHLGHEGEDLEGRFDLLCFERATLKGCLAPAPEKGEGGQPAG